jgi:putative tryptophan/tyrosine transport system substrate-binding protein
MMRREFITLLAGAAAVQPLAARAQQPAKLPTIGFLGQSTGSATSEWAAAFVQRLHELGWIENSTITIDYRWGEGLSEIAAEFVRLKVDVIVTSGTPQPVTFFRERMPAPTFKVGAGIYGRWLMANVPIRSVSP